MQEFANYALHPQHDAPMPQISISDEWRETNEQESLRTHIWGPPPQLMVRFYYGAERDPMETERIGAPVYREKICALIQAKGEKDCLTVNVTDEHIERYPREWQLFQRSSQKPRPIPLEALPKMRPNIKAALEELKITCVQDLVVKDVPEYLKPWKYWATVINGIHDVANGKPKPRLKLVDGQMVAA